jgi:ubiquinone/menaquinone biosynthesis C-methylase UbiE
MIPSIGWSQTMSFYEDRILPHLINCACGNRAVARQRKKVVPLARGRVLEVGMGSALNLPFYDRGQVELIWGLEPSSGMRRKAEKNIEQTDIDVRWLDLPGEQIPLDDHSVDSIVLTFTLCTIPDPGAALAQMRRVLKPGGQLLFCEHGEAPDAEVQRWQNRINPWWRPIAGGCNLNRPIDRLINSSGFHIDHLETGYLPKTPRFAGYNYWGHAS